MYRNLKYVLYHGTIATIEKIDINQGKGRCSHVQRKRRNTARL
jgi:hypothetical protein